MPLETGLKLRLRPTNPRIPAGIFPRENGNREYGRENTPTDPVPVPARFPVFISRFPVFPEEMVYGQFRR